jgi:hypothetical protein
MKASTLMSAFLGSLLVFGLIATASADIEPDSTTVQLDTWKGSPPVPSGSPWGSVLLQDSGSGTVVVTVTLNSNNTFTATGAGAALTFDILGSNSVSITGVTSGFCLVGSACGTTQTASAGTIHEDGTGTWQYSIECTACGGGFNAGEQTFSFTVQGMSDEELFALNGSGLLFASDVCVSTAGTTCIATGDTSGTAGPSNPGFVPLPEPMSITIFGAGLLAFGVFRARKRRS